MQLIRWAEQSSGPLFVYTCARYSPLATSDTRKEVHYSPWHEQSECRVANGTPICHLKVTPPPPP